ncbi:type ISP restriction/modification enzyme [Rubricoccus marinus]|uniref:type ISP restriction/modification enzyme n=1 Tax=Rubricoccus marinus TaxID=716817 RepID=UPI000B99A7FB|nr:type ISP restriction/modification enzyme [Rubricoccus marinus]
MTPKQALDAYADDVAPLAAADTTREETYYPALRTLVQRLLGHLGLPADVRTNTSERRKGGRDVPDLALYDGGGDFVTVCFEVKRPDADIRDLAFSTGTNDQVGRYLARTGVVVLSTVRQFALLTPDADWSGDGPVPPDRRTLHEVVEIWASEDALADGRRPARVAAEVAELLERAATLYAPIGEPETLARVLARQARRAKADFPAQFTNAVGALADDFGEALGVTFADAKGEEFFRSSLVQTVYYGLFAGWTLSHLDRDADGEREFHWRDIAEHLRLPFLSGLFHEIQHPRRLAELGLRPYLDLATETLGRVDEDRFFRRLDIPALAPLADGADEGVAGGEAGEGGGVGDLGRTIASAVVYFYEPFLETFDPDLRKELGVWYTPPEVVRYQVRRADALLREMGLARGLADESVVVLDPACGTGAYLIETLACIAETLRRDGVEDELGDTLLRAVERRVLGFEILTAPFVVAHLQIHLLLASLGAEPGKDHRPGVFLTNALTGWSGGSQLDLNFPELKEERDAALQVKTDAEVIVVLGNPPYNRFAGVPVEEEAFILDAYQGVTRNDNGRKVGSTRLYSEYGIRKQVLEDLYVRFFRVAEERVGVHAPHGVVSFISNNSFLRGRSHPLMRESLLSHFDEVWVDNLNGDKYRTGKRIPDWAPSGAGGADESVFTTARDPRGIQPGTAITTLVKRPDHDAGGPAAVHYRDFWGRADAKRAALLRSLDELTEAEADEAAVLPQGPRSYDALAAPTRERTYKLLPYETTGGYEDWYGLDELFEQRVQGVNPNRGLQEKSLVDVNRDALAERMRAYFSDDVSHDDFAADHPGLAKDWARYDYVAVREALQEHSAFDSDAVEPYVVFPLDARFIYYERSYYADHPDEKAIKLMNEQRRVELGENIHGNELLVTVPEARQTSEGLPLLATSLFDHHLHDRGPAAFPADVDHVVPAVEGDMFTEAQPERVVRAANLFSEVWDHARETFGLDGDLSGEDARGFVRRLFRVSLALLHAPAYQDDHRDALSQDWARVPVPRDPHVFDRAVALGGQIATLLDPLQDAEPVARAVLGDDRLAALAKLRRVGGGPVREGDLRVEILHFGGSNGGWRPVPDQADDDPGDRDGALHISDEVYFEDVPEAVWDVEIGGYPVVKKWLGYRDRNRRDGPLTLAEKDHLRGIVRRLAALVALRDQLDAAYADAIADPWIPPDVVTLADGGA